MDSNFASFAGSTVLHRIVRHDTLHLKIRQFSLYVVWLGWGGGTWCIYSDRVRLLMPETFDFLTRGLSASLQVA